MISVSPLTLTTHPRSLARLLACFSQPAEATALSTPFEATLVPASVMISPALPRMKVGDATPSSSSTVRLR